MSIIIARINNRSLRLGMDKDITTFKNVNNTAIPIRLDIDKVDNPILQEDFNQKDLEDLIECNESKKDLINWIFQNRELILKVIKDDVLILRLVVENCDKMMIDLTKDLELIQLIKIINSGKEIIFQAVENTNKLQGAIKKTENLKDNKIYITDFGYYFLVLSKIITKKELKTKSISINPYNQYYKFSKDDFEKINFQLAENIFESKNELSILEFIPACIRVLSMVANKISKETNGICFHISNQKIPGVDIHEIDIARNILFKGVPGTGKSYEIDRIIKEKFKIEDKVVDNDNIIENKLRINIHSCLSNADLMEGIGVSTGENNNIIYKDKKGSILRFIFKAIEYPNIPFFLILEEIQENSLNQLIGDLIYLIEESKRVDLSEIKTSNEYLEVYEHIEYICNENLDINYVTIPNLIEYDSRNDHKLIFPKNIYVMCTTNYRADKKIIEDNLFRRFEVVDIFPDENIINDKYVKKFYKILNEKIAEHFAETELHCDRYLIGHASWINVKSELEFNKAFLKVVNEFKEVREVEYDDFIKIIKNVHNSLQGQNEEGLLKHIKNIFNGIKDYRNYYDLIKYMMREVKNVEKKEHTD